MLLDTSFLVAYLDSRDQNHGRAKTLMNELDSKKYGGLFISEYAFDELMTLLRRHVGHRKAVATGEHIIGSVEFVWAEAALFRSAWEIYKKHEGLSFTDCYQVGIMRHFRIGFIASFDSGFDGMVKVLGKG